MRGLKFFLKWVLPIILALGVLIEGTSWGMWMANQPSDLLVLAGTILTTITVSVFVGFILWFGEKIVKRLAFNGGF